MTELFPHSEVYSRRVKSPSSARVVYGEMAEILICERFKAARLTTSGIFCPDVRLSCGTPAEVKSSRDGKVVVYKFRLERELEHAGPSYPYFIVVHFQRALSVSDFFRTACVVRTNLGAVLDVCEGLPLKRISKERQSGYNRNGYADGYYTFHIRNLTQSVNCPTLHP